MKNEKTSHKQKKRIERVLQLATKNAPFQYVEAYKSLRTNLDFMAVDKKYKKIVVTSSIPGEGKSNVVINLACSLAETGKTVLIVDCDLRKSVMHKYLNLGRRTVGLTHVLSGAMSLENAITMFTDLGIDVLAAGAVPPNPAELLGSSTMQTLVERFAEMYDYVLFDTPPVSVVTDAAVLGRFADGAVLVVRQKFVKIESALLAKKNLESTNVNIIGTILNGFSAKGTVKDSGYYYSYEYEYKK